MSHEDYDWIAEHYSLFDAANSEAQSVHANVVYKQLADSIGVAWVGERSFDDHFQTKFVFVKMLPDVFQVGILEQPG
jgi:hypothetical protein